MGIKMGRRGFFGVALAPLVVPFVPKPVPYGGGIWKVIEWPRKWGKSRLSSKRVQWLQSRINRDYNELVDNIMLSRR